MVIAIKLECIINLSVVQVELLNPKLMVTIVNIIINP